MSMTARRIVMLGPPGSGKGTYGKLLAAALSVPHISTGDALRAEIAQETPIGRAAQQYTKQGTMVPTKVVAEIVQRSLALSPEGWILDGYPRSVDQAAQLGQDTDVDLVVAISMRQDFLVRKLAGRRLCTSCGVSWNVEDINEDGVQMPPMLPTGEHNGLPCGTHCLPNLTQRADDKPEVIEQRLQLYFESETPLLDFYRASTAHLETVTIVGGLETMLPRFKQAVGLDA